MTFYQLERFRELTEAVEVYKQRLEHIGSLQATRYDSIRGGNNSVDKIGDAVVKREKMREKLSQLEQLKEKKQPDVEKTIAAATAAAPSKSRVTVAVAFRMRYLSGRDWDDISKIAGIKNCKHLLINALDRLEEKTDAEKKDGK